MRTADECALPARCAQLTTCSLQTSLFRTMKLGMIGLGKMGANMARRLMDDGHEVVGFDLD